MRTYKLYATASATTNAAASINIVKSGRIRNIRWSGTLNSVVDNDEAIAELSLVPVHAVDTNDTAGPIDDLRLLNNGTSGGIGSVVSARMGLDLPVGAGEKLYLNIYVVGGAPVLKASCFVDIEE